MSSIGLHGRRSLRSARSKSASEVLATNTNPDVEKTMQLVGPWISGFTRRTGITMKLLGIPFEHLDLNAYTQKEEVRRYSPMGKVPALVPPTMLTW
jgi:Glutathione S-transferase, N-terminal domain